MSSSSVIVFAKQPHAGSVKTRLTPPLSSKQAATFYGALLDDILMATAECAARLDLKLYVATYPPDACGALEKRAPEGFQVIAQRGRNLAERMEAAIAEVWEENAGPILLRSSDSPGLGESSLREALLSLTGCEIVLSPDPDGGYSLVGLRRPFPGLFCHPMSSPHVLNDTLTNARQKGLSVRCIAPNFDIDRIQDIALLRTLSAEEAEKLCPRTMALVELWGL